MFVNVWTGLFGGPIRMWKEGHDIYVSNWRHLTWNGPWPIWQRMLFKGNIILHSQYHITFPHDMTTKVLNGYFNHTIVLSFQMFRLTIIVNHIYIYNCDYMIVQFFFLPKCMRVNIKTLMLDAKYMCSVYLLTSSHISDLMSVLSLVSKFSRFCS